MLRDVAIKSQVGRAAVWFSICFIGFIGFIGARIASDPLELRPRLVDFGTINNGKPIAHFELVNYSPWSYQVAGISKSCDCMSNDQLPCSVPAFGRKSFAIQVDLERVAGKVAREGAFVVPSSRRVHFPFTIQGEVQK
jgi:hypothetical protein